ncbi:hypothetical protein Esti_000125 [Eimeria stiedai]
MVDFILLYVGLRKERMQRGFCVGHLLVFACCFLALEFMLAAPGEVRALPSQIYDPGSALSSEMHQGPSTDLKFKEDASWSPFLAPTVEGDSMRLTHCRKRPIGLAAQGAFPLISALMVVFVLFCFARQLSSEKEMAGARTRRLAAGEGGPALDQCDGLQDASSSKEGGQATEQSEPDNEDEDDGPDLEWDPFVVMTSGGPVTDEGTSGVPGSHALDLWELEESDGDGVDPLDDSSDDDIFSEGSSGLSVGGRSRLFTSEGGSDADDELSSDDEDGDEDRTLSGDVRESLEGSIYVAASCDRSRAMPVFPPGFHLFWKRFWLQGLQFGGEPVGSTYSSEIDGDEGSDKGSEGEYPTAP